MEVFQKTPTYTESLIEDHVTAQQRARQVGQEYEDRRNAILAAVQADLDALAAEYAPLIEDAHRAVSNTDAAVRAAVLAEGRTVTAAGLMAVYVKPSVRATWDNARLEGYATAHPEILAWRKQTEVAARVDFKVAK